MINKIKLPFLVIASLALFSCASPNPGSGKAGGSWVKEPVSPTDLSSKQALLTSEACAENWLGLFSAGDASIEKAIKNGKIINVVSVDRVIKNYGGLYASSCTIVSGY